MPTAEIGRHGRRDRSDHGPGRWRPSPPVAPSAPWPATGWTGPGPGADRVPVGHLHGQRGRVVPAGRHRDPGGRAVAPDPVSSARSPPSVSAVGSPPSPRWLSRSTSGPSTVAAGAGRRLPRRFPGGRGGGRRPRDAVARGRLLPGPRRPIPDPDDLGPRWPATRAGPGTDPGGAVIVARPGRGRGLRCASSATWSTRSSSAGSARTSPSGPWSSTSPARFVLGLPDRARPPTTACSAGLAHRGRHRLIGAYTTFSTFTFDTVRPGRGRPVWAAPANVAASVVVGLGAAAAWGWPSAHAL